VRWENPDEALKSQRPLLDGALIKGFGFEIVPIV